MGNTHSSTTVTRIAGALDTYVSELGSDIVYDRSLGSSRFLKAVRCRHRNGFLVVKIFIKPNSNQLDEKYSRRLKKEKKALQDVQNVYTFQQFNESEKAGYIIRQWVASSLYDRISTRPFLSLIEKKWIAFQILTGLRDARKKKVSHGDLKSENILVTSWNWVYITDFSSSFKPTYLPLDNPSDFAYFYDISGRRSCYVAPERFFTAEKGPEGIKRSQVYEEIAASKTEGSKKDGKVTEAMDVFSAGCVLAELFLEGTALFTLSQLFKYREGELDVDLHLSSIEGEQIRSLIKRMIAIDPANRPTFDSVLHTSRGSIFPESFYTTFHDFISSVNDISMSTPFSNTANTSSAGSISGQPRAPTIGTDAPVGEGAQSDPCTLPTDSDCRIMRIWTEFDVVEPCFSSDEELEATTVKVDYATHYSSYRPLQSVIPVVIRLSNMHSRTITSTNSPTNDGPALLILSLICANIRNCSLPSSKLRALDMLLALSTYLTDEAKLDRLLPYVIELFHDEASIVRAAALRTTLQILAIVRAITPFNADIFPQYILPYLRYTVTDPELSVRSVAAQSIVPFANLATKYLEMGQALRTHGSLKITGGTRQYDDSQTEISYDVRLEELQTLIEDQLSILLVDQSSVVKRSVLLDIAPLCIFFGRQKTNDILLSHMITYLNDRDWLLRYAFFDSITDVAACVGGRNLEEYIFPLMTQALSDAEETNAAKVLATLTSLSELGLFQKMRLWELMSSSLPLLYHPNTWIRQGAALFIASAAKALPITDVWCILYPSLKHFLRSELRTVEVQAILKAMKAPLPRHIYDFALDWAMKMGNSQFWKSQRKSTKQESPKEAAVAAARKGGRSIRITLKSEEDELQLGKLAQLGMSQTEEAKLIALKDYIAKHADAVTSLRSRQKADSDSDMLQVIGHVELQKLGVVPQTVFLASRSNNYESTSRRVSERIEFARSTSFDPTAGAAPFEDLRRRLATINGSNTSLNPVGRERGSPLPQRLPTNVQDLPPSVPMRPGSPTESIVSTANSISMKPRFGMGAYDVVKAAPAIGSNKTVAVGLLEAPGRGAHDVESERSGVTSPVSFVQTARGIRSPISSIQEENQDSALNALLEHVYRNMNREALVDFGPLVHEGPVRRRNTTRQNFTLRDSKRRNIEASLIAHLNSHTDAVNGIAISPDHLFFVSCSDDKTVRVWDSARLERNVTSKPRHTYGQHHSKVKCICILEGHHAFASAAEDGSLHVVRIDVNQSGSLPKYNKLHVVREYRVERPGEYIQCLTHYNSDSSSNLIYATNHSSIVVLDLSTMRISLTMENSRHFGPIVSICLDRKRTWLVAATLSGALSLWDLRFGLLLRTWNVGGSSTNRNVRIRQCVLHPSKGRGRWIIVAVEGTELQESSKPGTELLEVWDVEQAILVETFIYKDANQAEVVPQSDNDNNDNNSSMDESTSESKDVLPSPSPNPAPSPSPSPSPSPGQVDIIQSDSSPAAAIAALVRARQANASPSPSPLSSSSSSSSPFSDPSNASSTFTSDGSSRPAPVVTAMTSGVDFGGHSNAVRSFVDLSLDAADRSGSGSGSISGSGRAGFLVSGGKDCSLKLLDLERYERSVLLSERDDDRERANFVTLPPTPTPSSTTPSFTPTPLPLQHIESPTGGPGPHAGAGQRAGLIMGHQPSLLRAHQDTITAVACLDSPFRGGIVSADQAGVIKVWRVEGMGSGASGETGLYG